MPNPVIHRASLPPTDTLEGLRRATEAAFNRLIERLNLGGSFNDFDVRDHRVVNVAWPADLHDAVNVEYLHDFIGNQKKKKASRGGAPGTVAYTPTVGPYAMMGFKDFTLAGNSDSLHVVVWYVEEGAIQYLYGVFTDALDASANTPTLSTTVFSRPVEGTNPSFATGDLVLINDPDQDPVNTTRRKYEIVQLGAITGTQPGTVTITLAGRAKLSSVKNAHNAGRRFYKVKVAHFIIPTKDNSGNATINDEEFVPLGGVCVVAMAIAAADAGAVGNYNLKNCSQLAYPYPGSLTKRNPAPGFRTCIGAEYTLPLVGSHVQGQTMPVRITVAENASPRCMAAHNTVAPVGSVSVYNGVLANDEDVAEVAYVLYTEPLQSYQENKNRRVAVLDQLAIKSGDFASYVSADIPDFRRMPYRLQWPFELPVVGTVDSLFDPDLGSLRTNALPFNAIGETLWLEEFGELDGVIARAGSTVPGSHMTLSVLT